MLQNAYYTRCKDDAAVLRYAALPTKSANMSRAMRAASYISSLSSHKLSTVLAAEYYKTIGNILPLNMQV